MPKQLHVALVSILSIIAASAQASTLEQYLLAGGPALDRDWHGKDYQTISTLIKSNKITLPVFSDPLGSRILQKMTSFDNFLFDKSSSVPLQTKREDLFLILSNINPIVIPYVTKLANGDKSLHKEATVLCCYSVYVSSQCLELMKEAKATLFKDSWNQVRQDGFNKMIHGYTEQILGNEQSITEKHIYSSEDLSLFIKTISDNVQTERWALSDQTKKEVVIKFKNHLKQFQDPKDQVNIKNIINKLSS